MGMLGSAWTRSSIWANQKLTDYNVNRKYLKYGGYAAGGVGALMGAGMMYGSYGRHGTAANIYTGINTVAGGALAGLAAHRAGMGRMGVAGVAAAGAFASDRFSRFQENHPIASTALVAGAAAGAYAWKKNPALKTGLRRWADKAAIFMAQAGKSL